MAAERPSGHSLDAWPLLAFLQNEQPAADRVRDLLLAAGPRRAKVWMSVINLGEVYYRIARVRGCPEADDTLETIRRLPVRISSIDDDQVIEAARLPAQHPIAYADAFALVTARRHHAVLLTGDPELIALQGVFPIETLRRDG